MTALTVLSAASWVVAGGIVLAPLAGAPGSGAAFAGDALVVSGDVADLVPGRPAPLVLTVDNPGAEPVVVRTLDAAVSGGSSGCALEVTPWSGRLVVPARGQATQQLTATPSAGADCTGVAWSLSYRAGA